MLSQSGTPRLTIALAIRLVMIWPTRTWSVRTFVTVASPIHCPISSTSSIWFILASSAKTVTSCGDFDQYSPRSRFPGSNHLLSFFPKIDFDVV